MIVAITMYLLLTGVGEVSTMTLPFTQRGDWCRESDAGTGDAKLIAQQQTGTSKSSVGTVGKRQVRVNVTGINPMGRIDNRIVNKIQLRIRNRIDPLYNPNADAAAGIDAAIDSSRSSGRP